MYIGIPKGIKTQGWTDIKFWDSKMTGCQSKHVTDYANVFDSNAQGFYQVT